MKGCITMIHWQTPDKIVRNSKLTHTQKWVFTVLYRKALEKYEASPEAAQYTECPIEDEDAVDWVVVGATMQFLTKATACSRPSCWRAIKKLEEMQVIHKVDDDAWAVPVYQPEGNVVPIINTALRRERD